MKITFREDLNLQTAVQTLDTNKVSVTTFNSTVNDIQTKLTNLDTKIDQTLTTAKAYADDLVNALKANEIKALQDAVNLLNGDESPEGSVDYKIKEAITAIVNGAPEEYDTLKELLQLIQEEGQDLTDLINQINTKIAELKGNVSADFDTLEKIEGKIKETQQQIADSEVTLKAAITSVANDIPVYQYQTLLPIAEGNKITLPVGPAIGNTLIRGRVEVVSTVEDANGNITEMTVESIYTAHYDSETDDGKTYIIDATEPLVAYKANVEYFVKAGDLGNE